MRTPRCFRETTRVIRGEQQQVQAAGCPWGRAQPRSPARPKDGNPSPGTAAASRGTGTASSRGTEGKREGGSPPPRCPSAALVNNRGREGKGEERGKERDGTGRTHRVGGLHHVLDGAAHAGQALPHGEPGTAPIEPGTAPRARQCPPRPGPGGGGRLRGGGWNGAAAVPR